MTDPDRGQKLRRTCESDPHASKRPLSRQFVCASLSIEPPDLDHYVKALHHSGAAQALEALGRAISHSQGWSEISDATLIVTGEPSQGLAVLGIASQEGIAWLAAQTEAISRACGKLRYVGYSQVEVDCERLAARLVEVLGPAGAMRARFAAIPRGGHIVLGLLAARLRLSHEQLVPPYPSDVPLVVVDDCALSGARLAWFLDRSGSHNVIFGSLYSHPLLRAAVAKREPRVVACVSAQDLKGEGRSETAAKREGALDRTKRYWAGVMERICFPWNEPDHTVWDVQQRRTHLAWRIVPPELCFKNRLPLGDHPIPVQVQPVATGPLRPREDVVFGEMGGEVVVWSRSTGRCVGLGSTGSEFWRAIIRHGTEAKTVSALRDAYDVAPTTLHRDLERFVSDLVSRRLLVRGSRQRSRSHGILRRGAARRSSG